ncbi:ThiJ/PfpI [Cylindrobasidium torrendii FP15055 ss-10]|uniref:D-lactate dehydratase n=1 Tax=Cylindrobasidium torrendii FP15055 ss-10 TaxID=1314674 RepID=A0A0D7BDS6_9AGAR|nr:ThiJ/PfpI [Cylindrobasidium torrendii FP15055 ss-10]
MSTQPSILFVFDTSASKGTNGAPIGWWLSEASHPYYTFAPHLNITFASLAGPNPPVDAGSVELSTDDASVRFLKDPVVQEKLSTASNLSDINSADFDAIFYVGGHGPVVDLPEDEVNIRLAGEFWRAGKVTAAVCHGPAYVLSFSFNLCFSHILTFYSALANVVNAAGKSIFDGRAFTALSNAEETLLDGVNVGQKIPWSVEDKLTSKGGKFEATDPFQAKVVVDGNLYTGQNPASAGPLAQAVLQALRKK